MHLICMPFVGGSTLLDVLKVARVRGQLPRSGRAFLEDLEEVSAPEFPGHAAKGPVRESLARMTYSRAAAWIVARLAEALDHAQRQGVTHGDLKPSNVLIAADGRPMLLDFNLALDWRAEDDGQAARGGGTLAYMPPERLEVISYRGSNAPAPTPLARHRADLYALGYVLLEILSGDPPSVPEDTGQGKAGVAERMAEARSRMNLNVVLGRPCIPAGLRPILKRCLAADPEDRYTNGWELATDLDCWRQDRPLLVADEPTWPVRLARWTRTRRKPLIVGALMVVLGGIVELATSRYLNGSLLERARTKLELMWSGAEPGVYRFLARRHWRPDDALDPQTARRQRAMYGLLEPGAAQWRDRPDVAPLPVADREDLELWLLDRTWNEATARLERSDDEEDMQQALVDLERIPEWAALEPVLRIRRQLRSDLDLPEPPDLVADRASPEWVAAYLRGLEAESRNASEALVDYQRVLALRPESYWANYRAASVLFRLGQYKQAAEALDRSLLRRPEVAALHAQKAACLFLVGDDVGSLQESDLAIELDPDEPHAYRNRAFTRARMRQTRGLETDLKRYSSLMSGQTPSRWELRLQTTMKLQDRVPIDALESMESTLSADDTEMRNSLGALMDEVGHERQAVEQYNLAIQSDHEHLIAWFRLREPSEKVENALPRRIPVRSRASSNRGTGPGAARGAAVHAYSRLVPDSRRRGAGSRLGGGAKRGDGESSGRESR